MHEGHRKRILQRLEQNDPQLQDHELIEIALFNTIPRMNTNGIAHELLSTFGSLYNVLHAPVDQLCLVKGIGPESASYLRAMGLLFDRVDDANNDFPKSFTRAGFTSYLREKFAADSFETIAIFALNEKERIMMSKRFTSLRDDSVRVTPEEICEWIVRSKAHGIVVAHNHPNKGSAPSRADDLFTSKICMICSLHNIRIYDHLIVGTDGVYSYFEAGKLDGMRAEFSFSKVFGENRLL